MTGAPSDKKGLFEYDRATGTWLVALMVFVAVVLGVLAFSYEGSPRMEDTRKAGSGATIPNPTELSPAPTRPQ